MKTIKFVDIRDYDTNTSSIAAHLTEALKRIRKNKLAVDLIGDDEKSEGLKSNDLDGFADELSAGVELTYRDKNRILERARRLAAGARRVGRTRGRCHGARGHRDRTRSSAPRAHGERASVRPHRGRCGAHQRKRDTHRIGDVDLDS